MRRRPLSSGLIARDQIACVAQASAKCREAKHDVARFRHLTDKVKCVIRRGRSGDALQVRLRIHSSPGIVRQNHVRRFRAGICAQMPRNFAVA